MTRWDWTQPICRACFAVREPGREPARLREPDAETCCVCGAPTREGIYVRIDPDSIAHPTRLRD